MIASTHPFCLCFRRFGEVYRLRVAWYLMMPGTRAMHMEESEGERGRDGVHTTRGQARTENRKTRKRPLANTKNTQRDAAKQARLVVTALQHQGYRRRGNKKNISSKLWQIIRHTFTPTLVHTRQHRRRVTSDRRPRKQNITYRENCCRFASVPVIYSYTIYNTKYIRTGSVCRLHNPTRCGQ